MVVRALGGPVALLTGTVLLTALVVVAAPEPLPVAVSEAALVEKLAEVGLQSVDVADPRRHLSEGVADRAVFLDGEQYVIVGESLGWRRWSAGRVRADLLLESVVREHASAGWRLRVPPLVDAETLDETGGTGLAAHVHTLLRMLGVLYTLYAVVLVVAAAVRDREDGTLESLGATAVPAWVHPLSRGLAVCCAVGVTLFASELILAGLFGGEAIEGHLVAGLVAVVAATAVGTIAPTGRGWRPVGPFSGAPDGLSTPLSRALVVAMALAGLGWSAPSVAPWLPIGSVVAGEHSAMSLSVAAVVALILGIVAVARAGRARW